MVDLNSKTIINQFALDIRQLQTSWQILTAEQRQDSLKQALDQALKAANLASCAVHGVNLPSDTQGEFLSEKMSYLQHWERASIATGKPVSQIMHVHAIRDDYLQGRPVAPRWCKR